MDGVDAVSQKAAYDEHSTPGNAAVPGSYEPGTIEAADDTFVVMPDKSGRTCEDARGCQSRSFWYVERCPLPDESYLPPVRYVCSRHVVDALNELLTARRERRADA